VPLAFTLLHGTGVEVLLGGGDGGGGAFVSALPSHWHVPVHPAYRPRTNMDTGTGSSTEGGANYAYATSGLQRSITTYLQGGGHSDNTGNTHI